MTPLHRLQLLLPREGKRLLEVKICDENHRDTVSGGGAPHVGARSPSDSHKEQRGCSNALSLPHTILCHPHTQTNWFSLN